jgi:PAS domain S-box-containing protein
LSLASPFEVMPQRAWPASLWLGLMPLLLSVLVLIGWPLHVDVFTRLLPWYNPMNPLTAVAILLGSLAWLGRNVVIWRRSLALCVFGIGALTLARYLGTVDHGLDKILYATRLHELATVPVRLAPETAFSLVVLGLGLGTLDADAGRYRHLQWLGMTLIFVAVVQIMDRAYIRLPEELVGLRPTMALNTALSFYFLGVALICTYPYAGVMRLVNGPGSGGLMLRRIFPAASGLALVTCQARLFFEYVGLLSSQPSLILVIALSVATLAGIVLWCARALEVQDGARREATDKLAEMATETEISRRRMESLMDAVPIMIAVKDRQGRYTYVNHSSTLELGFAREEILGKTLLELTDPRSAPIAQADDEVLLTGQTQEFEAEFAGARGLNTISFLKFPLRNVLGEIIESCVVATNVTERNAREKELREAHDSLESLNQELASFSSSIAHDLRTPLRALDGLSQIVIEDYGHSLDPSGRLLLERIRKASQRMARLLDDLGELSRVTRATLRKERIDLSDIAKAAAAVLTKADPTRCVVFDVSPNITASGDPHLMRVVIENLLENAWKFTAQQANAVITVSAQGGDANLTVCVRDNGTGFNSQHKDQIFAPFSRLVRVENDLGEGMGLATVQRIVGRHGGRAWAESVEGEGAAFYFNLGERAAGTAPLAWAKHEVS